MVYCGDVVEAEGPEVNDYKYMHIVETLQARIASGAFPDGKLPSTKQLREEFQASYGSVRSAILILKTLGMVEGRQGQGVFVVE